MVLPDPRAPPRWSAGIGDAPTTATLDRRTVQSPAESGVRAGPKRRKSDKVHRVADTPGCVLALRVTSTKAQEPA